MIARPFHAANVGLDVGSPVLPRLAGIDLASTDDRVRGWGGDIRFYRHFLNCALEADDSPSAEQVRAIAVVAAWRSGIVAFRDEALQRATDAVPRVSEAALGIEEGTIAGFLTAQRDDPFGGAVVVGHGDGARAVEPTIARVGGFRGLGGPWLAPPREPVVTGPGSCAVRSDEDWWGITADLFGVCIAPLDERPATVESRFTAVTREDSYLVDLVRRS